MANANDKFKLLTANQSGSEAVQDIDLWAKLRVNHDLLEPTVSGYGRSIVATHFSSAVQPWWLRVQLGGGTAAVVFAYNNRHQARLTTGVAPTTTNVVLDASDVAGSTDPEAWFRAANANFADFFYAFRFNTNISYTNHSILCGLGNSGITPTVDPTIYIALEKGATAGKLKFRHTGLAGAASETPEFTAGNNDNQVTYRTAVIAILNSTGKIKCYYDVSGGGDLIEQVLASDTITVDTVVHPFFKAKIDAGVAAGELFVDYMNLRPLSVKEL